MGVSVKVVKKGNSLDKIRSNIDKIHKESTQVGYFSEQGNHSSGLPYATLMAIQEFGTDDIPSRPVFQIVAHTESPKSSAAVRGSIRSWSRSLLSKDNSQALLDQIGKIYQESLKGLFGNTSVLSPNSPVTIRLKGRDEPLVDSGELKDNLGYRTSKNKDIRK